MPFPEHMTWHPKSSSKVLKDRNTTIFKKLQNNIKKEPEFSSLTNNFSKKWVPSYCIHCTTNLVCSCVTEGDNQTEHSVY